MFKKIAKVLTAVLASFMMTDSSENELYGSIVTPKSAVLDLKKEVKRQAVKKKMAEIVTDRGPELHDWRPTKSRFQPPSKAEQKEFLKKNKKAIKEGRIIIIKCDKHAEKYEKKGIIYKHKSFNYVPLNYDALSKDEKKKVMDDLRKKGRQQSEKNS